MDWPRAKSILIVSFIILNLLLSYRLYVQPTFAESPEQLSKERLEAIERLLEQSGMTVEATLPRPASRLPVMNIRLRPFAAEEITRMRDSILGAEAQQTSPHAEPLDGQPVSFIEGYEELVITSRGYAAYYHRGLEPTNAAISEDTARQMAAEFMRHKLGGPSDFVFDGVSYIEPMGYRVDYVQKQGDSFVYPGYIMMIVKPSGVAAMWLSRLEIKSQWTKSTKGILTPHEALFNLLSHRLNSGEHGPITITSVDSGFHSNIYDSDQAWQAWPVWRIRTSSGDYYVNAVSGSIVQ